MATTAQSRPRRRPPNPRQAAPAIRHGSSTTPTAIDQRRFYDFRAGISIEELATRENVRTATIQTSIDRMISYQGRFSQEAAEVATRQLYLATLPKAGIALSEAMSAVTRRVTKSERMIENPDTGAIAWVPDEEITEEPDHKTRLEATRALQSLLTAVQPKTPMVQVDARSQHLHGGFGGGSGNPALGGGTRSMESLLRAVRAENGLDNGTGVKQLEVGVALPSADRDFELEAELEEDGEDLDEIIAEAATAEPEPEFAEED